MKKHNFCSSWKRNICAYEKSINRIKRKSFNSEKGSVTVFVLAIMLFMIIILAISYMSVVNKNIVQNKELNKIIEEYSKDNMEQEYEKNMERRRKRMLLCGL